MQIQTAKRELDAEVGGGGVEDQRYRSDVHYDILSYNK